MNRNCLRECSPALTAAFFRSLTRHRRAFNDSHLCSVPQVQVLHVRRVENRDLLARYKSRDAA